jgi:hypothetical protein
VEEQDQMRDLVGKATHDPDFYRGALAAMEKALQGYLAENGFELSDRQVAGLVRMDHANIEDALDQLRGGDIAAA